MEVQNGPENFMGLPYALLFFRRFDTPMEEMIQTAADQGLTGICLLNILSRLSVLQENLDFSLNIPCYPPET